MIEAVLCDLGDTLINFHHIDIFDAFHQGARETYDFLEQELDLQLPPFKRYCRNQQWAVHWSYMKSQITGREFNSMDTLKRCSRKLHIPVPEDRLDELVWRWYKPLAEIAKADPFAISMLEELRRRGLKLAIVSNTFVPPSALDRHLERENLIDYFPLRVYSCQVGVRKPRVEIFRCALDQLGVAPNHALFVGDSYAADIRGSRRAGMYAAYKSMSGKKIRLDPATFIVHSLNQIPGIIDQINVLQTENEK